MICKSCNLNIYSNSSFCPLCKIVIENENQGFDEQSYAGKVIYPQLTSKKKKLFSSAFGFITFSLSAISVFINLFSLDEYSRPWSLIIVSSFFCLHKSIFAWISSIRNSGSKIISQFLLLAQLVLIIDITIGYTGWALTYVIPWLAVATTFVITIVALASKSDYTEFAGHLIASFFIAGFLALLALFPVTVEKWGLLVALLYDLLTLLALYMFSKSQLKNEIKQRFKFR